MSTDITIRTTGLTKRFGDFTAVDQLSLAVPAGSIYAFLGANGSGKSTTIRMLIGLLTPTAGDITVDGIDVIRTPRRVRDHIGYMGQKVSLYAGLTIRENMEFYAGLYGLAGPDLAARWDVLRQRFDLADAEHERSEDLPAGLRQRAGLAVSTLHTPRVLLLDEPTAGVDLRSRALFWDIIQEEAAAGVTVFVTTHFLEEVDYCDRVCCIDAGRLIADGTPTSLRAAYGDAYVVSIDGPPAALSQAQARLGRALDSTAGRIRLPVPHVDPSLLATLEALRTSGAQVTLAQLPMTEIFGRLLTSNRAAVAA
jgi:ABC-2 type transport system ATP-binding protein